MAAPVRADEGSTSELKVIDYTTTTNHFFPCPDDRYWSQARAEAIPAKYAGGSEPLLLLTMQLHGMKGTHNYTGIVSATSRNGGKTWNGPIEQAKLDLKQLKGQGNGNHYLVPVDSTPQLHKPTGKVLLIGATFYVDVKRNKDVPGGRSDVFYAVYDPKSNTWDQWTTLKFPNSFKWPYKRSGCAQWVVDDNGDLLLPFYFGEHNNSIHYAAVARCSFDGKTLKYIEHGSEHMLDFGRGMSEPSLAKFNGKYYLTQRNDKAGYISTGTDGLHFSEAVKWKFDDGKDLGSYNTQQHFLTHSDALFLVYTRRGAGNDDVMRHRAPLFMAQIDPATDRVIRSTEQIVVEKEGTAAMGNFGTCNVSPDESWVVVAKRSTTPGEKNVLISKIRWKQPNKLATH